jgi:hypothetical protein
MGHVISKNGAIRDILTDLALTYFRCQERGGVWAAQGTAFLEPVTVLADRSTTDLDRDEKARSRGFSRRDLALTKGADAVARVYDELYNDLGRPQSDAYLAILIPGGADCIRDEKIQDRAELMDAIANTLETIGHPLLAADRTKAAAATIRAEAAQVREAVTAANKLEAAVRLDELVRKALAQVAQAKLVGLKLSVRALGVGEAQIHEVIPDRKRSPSAPEDPADAPAPVEEVAEDLPDEPDAAELPADVEVDE